jgi:hypothetical protein
VQHDKQGAFSTQIAHQQTEETVNHKRLTRFSQHNTNDKWNISHAEIKQGDGTTAVDFN